MAVCYIGLGANIDQPEVQIRSALRALQQLPNSQLQAVSSLYSSPPLGPTDQPDFYNAVAALETTLTPETLLDALQQQERKQGRIKHRHWGERCIDLDILLYDNLHITSATLTIPHKEMCHRRFVLAPLADIAADLILPDGRPIQSLLADCQGEVQRLGPIHYE